MYVSRALWWYKNVIGSQMYIWPMMGIPMCPIFPFPKRAKRPKTCDELNNGLDGIVALNWAAVFMYGYRTPVSLFAGSEAPDCGLFVHAVPLLWYRNHKSHVGHVDTCWKMNLDGAGYANQFEVCCGDEWCCGAHGLCLGGRRSYVYMYMYRTWTSM